MIFTDSPTSNPSNPGPDLWTRFIAANVPDADLRALGEDVGYKRDNASEAAYRALIQIASNAPFVAGQLFGVLKNHMPGIFSRKGLLEGLADDYDKRRAWAQLRDDTRDYITAVANELPKGAPVLTQAQALAVSQAKAQAAVREQAEKAHAAAEAPKVLNGRLVAAGAALLGVLTGVFLLRASRTTP